MAKNETKLWNNLILMLGFQERRAHDSTRRYLYTLKQFCQEAGLSIPEQADEEL